MEPGVLVTYYCPEKSLEGVGSSCLLWCPNFNLRVGLHSGGYWHAFIPKGCSIQPVCRRSVAQE